jgi:hypothetical protein
MAGAREEHHLRAVTSLSADDDVGDPIKAKGLG